MDFILSILIKLNLLTLSYSESSFENAPLNLKLNSSNEFSNGFSFVFMITLIIVILIILVLLYFYMSSKSLVEHNQDMGQYLRILERKRLGQNSYLYIIKLKDTGAIIAENSSGIHTLLEINDSELLKEIEVNTINKFENVSFDNFLKKEAYRISNLKKKKY